MDYSLSIFQGILSTEGTFLNLYLEGLDEQRKFSVQSNDGASLMQQISSLLTTASTRALGLRLLDKFIDNCSSDVLQKKGNLWTTLVLKALNNQELRCDDSLIFQILTKIIKRSQQVPDLAKSFASIHISKVYESLTNVSLSKSKYALSCIETCLRTYPGSSGPSRGIIERFLWKNLDHLNSEVVKNCGKCLHLLQQVKGGGVQGVNHKMQWKNYQLQLLGGIHDVYNEMFANCIEMYEDKIEQEHLPWGSQQIEFDPEPVKKAAQMYTRCRNLLTYLIIALREPFPVEKPILLKKILYIIIRGLSVNVLMLEQNPCAENIALTILLPKLHGDLLNLLNVVFLILRGHLRPYSERILGLIVDSLKWTSTKNVHGEQQILQNLRKQIYDTVSLWCKIFCSGSRCETIAEYLFQEILSDITPSQSEFTLKVLSGSRKHMSKKARRQLHNAQNEKSNMAKNHSNDSSRKEHFAEKRNQELCTSALRCLQEILFSAANFLKPTILKMMQTSITQIAAIFFELSLKPTHLYSNNICRVEIYNVLYALLTTTHHLCPPPTDLALTILQNAYTRDVSLKVRIRCGFILQNLEKVIHPQKESLLFTIEARDIRNTFIKMGQENLLSEFNVSNLLSNNANEDDSIDEPSETTILQYRNLENLGMENIDKTHSNSNIIIENRGKINNKTTDVADIIDEKSHKVQVTDVNITIEDQVDEHNEIFLKDTLASDKNIDSQSDSQEFVLRVDDDVDIAAIEDKEKCIYSDSNIDEPKAKKPKNYEHNEVQDKTEDEKLDSETDEAKNSNQIINMDQNEEDLLAEIASQFVDELD